MNRTGAATSVSVIDDVFMVLIIDDGDKGSSFFPATDMRFDSFLSFFSEAGM